MNPKDKSAELPSAESSESPGKEAEGNRTGSGAEKKGPAKGKKGRKVNQLRKIREDQLLTKAELARRANLSVLTIDRVEKGFGCRMDTKRKILEALGLGPADRVRVFGEEG